MILTALFRFDIRKFTMYNIMPDATPLTILDIIIVMLHRVIKLTLFLTCHDIFVFSESTFYLL